MQFQTEVPSGDIAGERIDRLAEWLQTTIGLRVTAFAAGVKPTEVSHYAHGKDRPSRDAERRLRNLYAVASLLITRDGPGSAKEWLLEPNPELDNRAPARLLREGRKPEALWFAVAPPF